MDVQELKFEDKDFDIVLDKGTLDAVLCNNNSEQKVAKIIQECHRVLRDDGKYIVMTYSGP